MRLLLEDKFAPVTSAIGFLKCPAKQAAEAYLQWMTPILTQREQFLRLTHHVESNLQDILQTLLPLTSGEYLRRLFVQTNSEWTAYFANGRQSSDVRAPVGVLAERIGCIGICSACIPNALKGNYDKNKGRYGSVEFAICGPHVVKIDNTLRSVYASNDGSRWVFGASGQEQSYEELEAYQAKRVKDRFTPEMLDRYLQALGIHAFDEQFYTSPEGFYKVEKVGQLSPNIQYFTLAEARAGFE